MSSDAFIADASMVDVHAVEHADNAEATTAKVFLTIVALIVGAAVGLGLTFGLAGIGALAIGMAGVMLLVCVLLTRG